MRKLLVRFGLQIVLYQHVDDVALFIDLSKLVCFSPLFYVVDDGLAEVGSPYADFS